MVSANRILSVLSDQFWVSNARIANAFAVPQGQVVGLCGQGGRHRYFTLSVADLRHAATEILGIVADEDDAQPAMDSLLGICRTLRARTAFETGQGCVNEAVPALVPLLPPEEIWGSGGELPLDVWRLLSFEYDLLSTALAADNPLNPPTGDDPTLASLAFARTMHSIGQGEVAFEVSESGFSPPYQGRVSPPGGMLTVPLRRLFWELGCLTTPLRADGFTAWYAAARYMHWLLPMGGAVGPVPLRVRAEFKDDRVDTRYRGVASEELAIGMSAVLLALRLDGAVLQNTAEVVANLPANQPVADFVAIRAENEDGGFVVETKGSLGRKVSRARKARAKEQAEATAARFQAAAGAVANLPPWLALTCACTLRYDDMRASTICEISDPPPARGDDSVEPLRVDRTRFWQVSYAKALRFVGYESAAREIAEGRPANSLTEILERSDQRGNAPAEQVRRRGRIREAFKARLAFDVASESAVVIDADVLGVLCKVGINSESVRRLADRPRSNLENQRFSQTQRRGSFITPLGIGLISYQELDES